MRIVAAADDVRHGFAELVHRLSNPSELLVDLFADLMLTKRTN